MRIRDARKKVLTQFKSIASQSWFEWVDHNGKAVIGCKIDVKDAFIMSSHEAAMLGRVWLRSFLPDELVQPIEVEIVILSEGVCPKL